MNPACEKVLAKLKVKRRGITFADFARGFRLGARVFDLREAGHRIVTVKEPLDGGGTRPKDVLR